MKLLIPVDGSPHSEAALRFVASRPFPREAHPQIDVLNVQYPVPPRAGRAVGAELVQAWHEAESRSVLQPAVAVLREAGLDPAWFYSVGSPGPEIAEWASAHASDLIVMGSHGRTARMNVLLGSVAQTVLAECRKPVLLIRQGDTTSPGSLRVGLALDGSEHSRAALRFALDHRAFFGPESTLHLAHVVDEVPIQVRTALANLASTSFTHAEVQAERRQAYDHAMSAARAMLAETGVEASEDMLVGASPAACLADWVRCERIDLLVMGSHGTGAMKAAVLGSVATGVQARCSTPLLLVRPH
jgi:nucleotide-binding universal stress UspA family protein